MDTGLKNKKVIVTAGAQGIGKATAILFATEGADVFIVDVNESGAQQTAKECQSLGVISLAVKGDMSSEIDVSKMVKTVVNKFGTVHILVNAVGIFDSTSISELKPANWDKIMSVNLRSVYLCSQAVLPHMKSQQYGKIVSIASLAAQVGGLFAGANYSVSKAGVMAFTKSLARQTSGMGINVNCISPGPVTTSMVADWPEEVVNEIKKQCPMRRFATPEEIANGIVFLSSNCANYIHGAHLDINGGLFMD